MKDVHSKTPRPIYSARQILPHTAVNITKSAYSSGKLDIYGYSHKETNIQELKLDERAYLCTCANDLLEYKFNASEKQKIEK